MCTVLGLIAGVARARLPYAENPVSGTDPACTHRKVPNTTLRTILIFTNALIVQ
jgi:hypothetical protein